jgi:hypothetical protein
MVAVQIIRNSTDDVDIELFVDGGKGRAQLVCF